MESNPDQLRASLAQTQDEVRELKKNKASKEQIDEAVKRLQNLKLEVSKFETKDEDKKPEFPRKAFTEMLTKRFFLAPSFEIYGGVAGLYDLGPPGTAIKANLLSLWRQHFILTEGMLEVDCTSVTPRPVLTASGHTAKFTDLMVKDEKNGNCFRADHLLEAFLEKLLETKGLDPKLAEEYKLIMAKADTYDKFEMHEILTKYGVKAPDTNNAITHPEPFNLMFQTQIGPTGNSEGFLRPETAQGIFVNFKRLLEYNGGKLPFAGAQIGQAFRNEIAPRSGLLRVREFTLAEIEHFVNPQDKNHPKFQSVANMVLNLYPRDQQVTTLKTVKMTVGDAVKNNIIANETLGYFIARTHLFLLSAGIKEERLRFRQHLANEMAHYACDCWDAEIQNSYGWTECVGIADRSAFDLNAHSKSTKENLVAFVEFPNKESRTIETMTVILDKKIIGSTFKGKGSLVIAHLETLSIEDAKQLKDDLAKGPKKVQVANEEFEITKEMVKEFKEGTKRVTGQQITPGVIEPSFGIGRILYSLLEHAYYTRTGDEQRSVLALPPVIAPVKVSVLPLIVDENLQKQVPVLVNLLNELGISSKVDDIGQTIGKRYARTDEIGIPFAITIDFDTLKDNTVTLRERDSTNQVRVPLGDIANLIKRLVDGRTSWNEIWTSFPQATKTLE